MLLVPTISERFDVSIGTAQWMLTINLMVGAIATPIMGRLSDGPHKRRLLVVSLVIVLIGSIIAAISLEFVVFLIGRALQGLTYGIVAVTISLGRRYLPGEKVSIGISSLSVTVATGIGIGYPLTGVLAGLFDYRIAFWFAALFVATAIIVVLRVVPAGPDRRAARGSFDLGGATALSLGLATTLVVVSEGPNWGWASPVTIGLLIASLTLLGAWVAIGLRSPHPLVNLRVLRDGDVLLANGTAIGLGAALYMGLSLIGLIAQAPASTSYGVALPVVWAGFVMFPLSVGSFAANRAVRRFAHRVRLTTLLPIGAAVVTASMLFLWCFHSELWEILLGTALFGVGIGTTYAALPGLIARSIAAAELGSAVSFNQVLRTVGGACGSAVSGAVLVVSVGDGQHPSPGGIVTSLAISSAICMILFVALMARLFNPFGRPDAQPSGSIPPT
jgi:predicted MFS family arabinose efflux permease